MTFETLQHAAFFITAFVAVVAAMFVVFHRNPVVNAVALILNLACIAIFFLQLRAPFLAAIQIIVYAGAIMVLFLFVIMLLDLRVEMGRLRTGIFQRGMGVLAAGGFLMLLGMALRRAGGPLPPGEVPGDFGSTERLAEVMLIDYVVPFEFVSILLLVAMVGALVLARAFFEAPEVGR